MLAIRCLLYLCLLDTVSSETLTVLETTSNMSLFSPNSGAELASSSLLGHNQVTVCARFMTYQFTTHLSENPSQCLLWWGSTSSTGLYSTWLGSDLQAGMFSYVFPIWDMNVWNHVCLMIDSVTKDIMIIVNGKLMIKRHDFDLNNSFMNENLSIMGSFAPNGYTGSLFGRMTDVNMWSRMMTEKEAVSWTLCGKIEVGDLVDWKTATWKAQGLEEVQVDREEVCRKMQDRLLVSNVQRNFDGTLHLARMLGGRMAIADSQASAEENINALNPVKEDCQFVFTGLTDHKEEGVWVNVYTGQPMSWRNWEIGQPDNVGNADCATINAVNYKQHAGLCTDLSCSLIRVKESPKFQLRGVCKDSTVDTYYTMLLTNDNKTILKQELVGFKQTKMIWSRERERWNIVNLIDGIVLAHTNSTHDFPFGSHP